MSGPEFLEFDTVVARTLGSIRGLKVVDIGAGSGRVTRQLIALGASVVGVEPNASMVEEAEADDCGARFVVAPAEATGLTAESFDLAVFSYSLHHVGDMDAGIREACRITRADGRVAVIEPEAPDPFYPVMRFIDDESAVYAEAQAALRRAVAGGALRHQSVLRFATKYRIETAAQVIEELTTIDSSRHVADADRAAFDAAFESARLVDETGGFIPNWARVDVFTRP